MNPLFLAMLMRTHQGPMPEDVMAAVKLLMSVEGMVLIPAQASAPTDGPPQDVERPEMAHANWDASPRIDRRAEDGGA